MKNIHEKTDVETVGLLGSVKQVKQICYKARKKNYQGVKGKLEQDDAYDDEHFATTYNEKGKKIEEYNCSVLSRHKVIYNEQGLPAETSHDFWDGIAQSRKTMKYDAQGHLLELIQYDDKENITCKIISQYDAKGNEVEKIQYNDHGNIIGKTINKYDDKPRLKHHNEPPHRNKIIGYGNLTEQISYNAKGEIVHKISSKFNDQGQILEDGATYANGTNNKTIRQYDDKGNMLEALSYDATGMLVGKMVHTYKYDKQGNALSYTSHYCNADGVLTHNSSFVCNEHGDAIEATHYDTDGNITETHTFEYEYDEDGIKINPWENEEKHEKLKSETEEFEYDAHKNWLKKTTFYSTTGSIYTKVPVHLYIREISYYGEELISETSLDDFYADFKVAHQKEYDKEDDNNDDDNDTEKQKPMKSKLTPRQTEWVSEAIVANDTFPIFRYYAAMYNDTPSLVAYTGPFIEAYELYDELTENLDAQEVHSFSTVWDQQNEVTIRYVLSFPEHPGYLLRATHIQMQSAEGFEIPEFMQPEEGEADYVYISQFELLRPSDISGRRGSDDEDDLSEAREFEQEIEDYINKCSIKQKPDVPSINMIEVAGNGFTLTDYTVKEDFEIKDLDVNYGYGFTKFHNDLMQRFNKETKGLVLFHGVPGTGKTYYIRHLLKQMASGNKEVIYMPPNLVDHLVEPAFMTFLSGQIQEFSEDGKFCVILIEDAEPLLAKRQEGVRIQGVTNLLNMTDGLLNDMLNLQIICTFNVDLQKLDSALLRPGRLIARKEFKALSELDANLLAQRLGIKHHFKKPATLGEIYALLKDKNTLIHDVEPDKGASTNIDDL